MDAAHDLAAGGISERAEAPVHLGIARDVIAAAMSIELENLFPED